VTLNYNPSSTEETEETYDPDQTVTTSMQRTEQTSGPQPIAAGVPGTASNAPNTQALPVYPQQTAQPQSAKSESGAYASSKTVRHTVENAGRVRRLTAAIVVNDRLAQMAAKGKNAVWQTRSADELRNLTALAQAAVGFDSTRGDILTVEDLAFDDNRAQQPVSMPVQVLDTAENSPVLVRYVAMLAGVLIVLAFGVRPALRRAGSAPRMDAKPVSRQLPAAAANQPPLAPPEPAELDPERIRANEIFEQVSGHLKKEPTQSSRLLQSWIHSD
jgi:flagellar M-ring protein FliF